MADPLEDKPLKPAESLPSTSWPLAIVLLCVLIGVGYGLLGHWLRASLMVAGSMGVAGLFRLFMPREMAGLLVVRRRTFDVAVYLGLAITMMAVAFIVPGR